MSLIADFLRRLRDRRTAEERWDERWSDPTFDWMGRIDELAHYSVLAGYALELKPGGAVLDVGCGDGVFRRRLHPDAFSTYVGVDFSEAITRARTRADDRATFVVGDLRTFAPVEQFDTIVFNESLYYVDDPIGELNRYAKLLKPDGIFLVSMHRKPKSERIWADIGGRFVMIDRVTIANRAGVEWIAGAFRADRTRARTPEP